MTVYFSASPVPVVSGINVVIKADIRPSVSDDGICCSYFAIESYARISESTSFPLNANLPNLLEVEMLDKSDPKSIDPSMYRLIAAASSALERPPSGRG